MVNHEVAQLVEATRTRAGMTVYAKLEEQQTEECASVNLEPHTFYRGLRDDFTVRSAGFLGVYGDQPRDCPRAIPANHLTPDCSTPLNQSVSRPALSRH